MAMCHEGELEWAGRLFCGSFQNCLPSILRVQIALQPDTNEEDDSGLMGYYYL